MPSISDRTRRRGAALLLSAALSVATAACERVVSVSAPSADPRLVVEARLERSIGRATGNQRIRLSTTESVFSTGNAPPVRGATVRVSDSTGAVTSFTESTAEPGVYLATAMRLRTNWPYTLQITWGGDTYRATERMLAGVGIDSLYISEGSLFPGAPSGLRATIDFRDPEATKNWYLWDQWIDDVRVISNDSASFTRLALPDELLNGSTVRDFQPFGGITVRAGQLVRVRQISIPEQVYRFYNILTSQTRNNGSPFGVPATNLRGNIANVTTPSRLPLGYFFAGEYSEREIRVTGLLGQ